jgi:hypothetical protein
MAMQMACFPGFFFLVALFARAAKIRHRQSRWLYEAKKMATPDISSDIESERSHPNGNTS